MKVTDRLVGLKKMWRSNSRYNNTVIAFPDCLIFLLRDALYALSVCQPATYVHVCPFVHPSVTLVDCVKTAERIAKLVNQLVHCSFRT